MASMPLMPGIRRSMRGSRNGNRDGIGVGYLTPIAAASALLLHGSIWFGAGIDSAAWAIIVAFNGIALALLGPGAYSLDSRLCRRRLVVLPPQ